MPNVLKQLCSKAVYILSHYYFTFKYHSTFPLRFTTNIHHFVIEDKGFGVLVLSSNTCPLVD